jgi:hypothetical protein
VVRIKIIRLLSVGALSAFSLIAGNVTFATFTEGTPDFTFTDSGATSTFDATSTIQFTFYNVIPTADPLLGPLPTTSITALLTRTGTVTQAATVSGSSVSQVLATSTLTITAGGKTLLASSGDNATLTGTLGQNSLSLGNSSPPNTLVFTSDYIDFSGAVATQRGVTFSVTDPLSIDSNDGLLNSFTASGTGSFAVSFAPEPSSISLILFGLLPLAFLLRRTRRRA